jgi:very-short-patch-repair endonuclease
LGVAAFSQAQQDAIQTQLERMRADHPELREFELLHPHEPFFVKNLENVQGDERDAIFISIGYGRDSEGYLSHSFGPLNPDGGERRLNVLISRAKHKCVVFSNFTHEDIDLHRTQSRGVQALKTFLKYAQTRVLDTPRPSGGDPESPFEEVVRDALVERGYRIDCQVGSAGFFIDLAVVDPDSPGRYLLGIECDGAKYHSARSARDRDRLREQVLIAKGWRIHRIWGPNWYRDPALCLARAEEAIVFALRAEERRATPGGDATAPPTDSGAPQPPAVVRLSEPLAPAANADVTPYEVAPLSISGLSVPLHEVPQAQLCEWAMRVVRIEGPVHLEEIVRRIREAAGLGRAGNRISGAIERALGLLCGYGNLERKGPFFWPIDLARPRVRSRDGFLPQHKRLDLISPQEIDEALLVTTGRALGITEDDLVAETLRTLGFGRVTVDLQGPVRARVAAVLQRGDLQLRGAQLFLSAPRGPCPTP